MVNMTDPLYLYILKNDNYILIFLPEYGIVMKH